MITGRLAAWAAILAAPTAIAGIYGMSFDVMPELHWKYGYFAVIGAIAALLRLPLHPVQAREMAIVDGAHAASRTLQRAAGLRLVPMASAKGEIFV